MQTTKETLSVISFNAFGSPLYRNNLLLSLLTKKTFIKQRFIYMADKLNDSDADIISLQEVLHYGQVLLLRQRLTRFPYVYFKWYITGPKGGLVIFSKLPFSSLEYSTFKQKGDYRNQTIIANIVKRGLLIGKLRDLPVTIINTHLTHNPDDDWSETNRFRKLQEAQLEQIVQYVKQHPPTQSLILAGDFNIPKASHFFQPFLQQTGLIDVFKEFHSTTLREEYQPKSAFIRRIDHIFLLPGKNKIDILDKHHIFEEEITLRNGKTHILSDHIGLFATFSVSQKKATRINE